MNDTRSLSQSSSDIFSETSTEISRRIEMDTNTYETLISQLKLSLTKDDKIISNEHFNTVIQDCGSCIEQCLYTIVCGFEDSNVSHRLCGYIEDAVCLLQMLSSFIRRVLESIPLVCCTMKIFPIVTANIILSVFNHCKNSECVYGAFINKVEKQLKDLFKSCHELQLIYLMIMEKHYTFDLSKMEEIDVLIEALDINLKIGAVVQSLDIKTMAEQWKAYTDICDKYSKCLLDKHIYSKCTELLSEMIKSNMKIALELQIDNGNEKAVLRPVKVASFGLKILSKICNIFKSASNDYDEVIDLLIYLYTHNNSYLDLFMKKSPIVIKLIEENIMAALKALLAVLVTDNAFLNRVCELSSSEFKDDKYIGYIVLQTAIMKLILSNNIEVPGDIKLKIVKGVFHLLPSGHTWFNIKLKIKSDSADTYYKHYNLFEYLLTVSFAFSRTFSCEQYSVLERIMYECLLDTDCYSSVFAADLWFLLLRSNDARLIANTTLSLLKVYQKLVKNHIFHTSPQKVYLTYTIRNFFKLCSDQDKLSIFEKYNTQDTIDIWTGVNLFELVEVHTRDQNIGILRNMSNGLRVDGNDGIKNMIGLLSLSPTRTKEKDQILEVLVQQWEKVCPCKCYNGWDYTYIERLTSITEALLDVIPKHLVIKIHGVMSNILKTGNKELIFLLFQKFCKLYDTHLNINDTQANVINDVLVILMNTNDDIRQYVYLTLNRRTSNKINKFIEGNPYLRNVLADFNYKLDYRDTMQLKNELIRVESSSFSHKCLKPSISDSTSAKGQSNFDLNIDSIFDNDDDNEPCSKKLKLTESDDLVLKLEEFGSRLCDLKDIMSEEQRSRISNVCCKLRNIVEH